MDKQMNKCHKIGENGLNVSQVCVCRHSEQSWDQKLPIITLIFALLTHYSLFARFPFKSNYECHCCDGRVCVSALDSSD